MRREYVLVFVNLKDFISFFRKGKGVFGDLIFCYELVRFLRGWRGLC